MILQKNSDYVLKLEKQFLQSSKEFEPRIESEVRKWIFLKRTINHAKFLKRELEPGMFVPCDENGNILKKPVEYDYKDETGFINNAFFIEMNDYVNATEKVLFKNAVKIGDKHFELRNFSESLTTKELIVIGLGFKNGIYRTIEDLANNFNSIELTENAIKIIKGIKTFDLAIKYLSYIDVKDLDLAKKQFEKYMEDSQNIYSDVYTKYINFEVAYLHLKNISANILKIGTDIINRNKDILDNPNFEKFENTDSILVFQNKYYPKKMIDEWIEEIKNPKYEFLNVDYFRLNTFFVIYHYVLN